ncbi:MAG TPA: hypothetical protein VFK14_05035 [Solirubrobacterales bacterium]|nr:hypothetical protein [Solirubrobacterales bacterium]
MYVDFHTKGRDVLSYSLVLVVGNSQPATVRVYDAAHGFNEMHRFSRRDGKQPGVLFHAGTLGEGMRAAMDSIKSEFLQMIEGWEGR